MTTVSNSLPAGLTAAQPAGATGTGSTTLDQNSFLTLLTTQLQTQDPFNPVDNNQMVSQMAQLSTVTGITQMNTSLSAIKDQLSGSRLSDAASWIGKSMLVKSNIATPDSYGQYGGQITLPADSNNVSVSLVDSSGNVVKSIDLGAQKAGDAPFYWNGKDDAGNTVTSQALQVRVSGAAPSQVATWATVAAVQSPADSSAAKLITPIGSFSPSDALRLG